MTDRSVWVGARLGLRMLWPRSRAERGAVAWLVAGSAIAMVAITVGFGLLQSISSRAAVVDARAPSFASAHDSSAAWGRVRVLDTGEGEATIYDLGPASSSTPPPPGVRSWPQAGEVWWSPAAAAQQASNPYLAALVHGQDIGRIGRVGLRDPDDVVVVRGVQKVELEDKPGAGAITGFGLPGEQGSEVDASREMSERGLVYLWTIGLATIAAGATGLMIGVARVADGARQQRLAVLQLLGAPLRTARALAAINSLVWSAGGAGVGLLLAWPAASMLSSAGIFGIAWWPARSFNTHVVVFSLAAMAAIAAWGGARSVTSDAWRTRRRSADKTLSLVRLAPLTAGLLLLASVVLSQAQHRDSDVATPPRLALMLLVAALLCGVGLAIAAPLVTRLLAAAAARRSGVALRVAAARVDHHVRETSRLALALLLLVLVWGLVLGAAQNLSWQSSARTSQDRVLHLPAEDDFGRAMPRGALKAALQAEGVSHAVVERASGATDQIRHMSDREPSDLGYALSVNQEYAAAVAGAVQGEWPDAPALFTDRDVAGDRGTTLMSGALLVCLSLAAYMALMALGVNLMSLQHGRRNADLTLLAVGMVEHQLTAVRWWEVVLAALPGPLLASLTALPLGIAVMHLDHANVPVPGTFALLPGTALLVVGVLAGAAAAAAPRFGTTRSMQSSARTADVSRE